MFLRSSTFLGVALLLQQGQCCTDPLTIPSLPKESNLVSPDLQSFSIEFCDFPDFAGNKSHPNEFTKALLRNFEQITGVSPVIRVGGSTQDTATYFPHQKEAVHLIYKDPSDDQPLQTKYGPGFFESYHTLGNIKFIHGLNINDSDPTHLQAAANAACRSIGSKLHLLELGNEVNMSPLKSPSFSNYSIEDYAHEWNAKSQRAMKSVHSACGDFPGFMAPSFYLLNDIDLSPRMDELADQVPSTFRDLINGTTAAERLFHSGYDEKNLTKELSFHNYMVLNLPEIAPALPNDLENVLMNHTRIVAGLEPHIQRAKNLAYLGHPYILGETNSVALQGRNGYSNVFGDALWVVDYSLWAAEHNIERLHFHQGLDYRYNAWQPIQTKIQAPTTRAPYYGHIMVASALGRSRETRVVNIPLKEDAESAYAIYDSEKLAKLVVLNMRPFNHTTGGTRSSSSYSFRVPEEFSSAKVERLIASGSDVLDGITFGGVSYDYDLKKGQPVVVGPQNETLALQDGVLDITLPDSSAVLLTLS